MKPIVLGIFERFYLPLQEELRPATKAFILALLPGLEEETGEWFEKVRTLRSLSGQEGRQTDAADSAHRLRPSSTA